MNWSGQVLLKLPISLDSGDRQTCPNGSFLPGKSPESGSSSSCQGLRVSVVSHCLCRKRSNHRHIVRPTSVSRVNIWRP